MIDYEEIFKNWYNLNFWEYNDINLILYIEYEYYFVVINIEGNVFSLEVKNRIFMGCFEGF